MIKTAANARSCCSSDHDSRLLAWRGGALIGDTAIVRPLRTRMKKWSIIFAATLVAAWLVVDTVREFFANETIQYFSSEPHQLLYVAAIAIVGGFAALWFSRLPPRTQRHVRVFAWGAAASTLTAFLGYFVFRFASLFSFAIESGGSAWIVLALLLFSGFTAYLWSECYRAWKTGVSQ